MSIPNFMYATPEATVTVAQGADTTASSEWWQRVAGNKFIVYEQVPNALMQELLQSGQPDTAIALQLAAYPKRVSS